MTSSLTPTATEISNPAQTTPRAKGKGSSSSCSILNFIEPSPISQMVQKEKHHSAKPSAEKNLCRKRNYSQLTATDWPVTKGDPADQSHAKKRMRNSTPLKLEEALHHHKRSVQSKLPVFSHNQPNKTPSDGERKSASKQGSLDQFFKPKSAVNASCSSEAAHVEPHDIQNPVKEEELPVPSLHRDEFQ